MHSKALFNGLNESQNSRKIFWDDSSGLSLNQIFIWSFYFDSFYLKWNQAIDKWSTVSGSFIQMTSITTGL